jgi:hypothetical protein
LVFGAALLFTDPYLLWTNVEKIGKNTEFSTKKPIGNKLLRNPSIFQIHPHLLTATKTTWNFRLFFNLFFDGLSREPPFGFPVGNPFHQPLRKARYERTLQVVEVWIPTWISKWIFEWIFRPPNAAKIQTIEFLSFRV